MMDFIQQESQLFGSQAAIDALADKECARLLVISDSHGSAMVVRAIVQQFAKNADALCFCGDGVQDVLSVFEEASNAKGGLSSEYIPPVAALVRGNGDMGFAWFCPATTTTATATIVDAPATEVTIPRELVLTVAKKHILVTHGHRYDVYYSSSELYDAAKQNGADVVLFGHTHIANVQDKDGITLLNPGSCSRPRGGQPHTFALVTVNAHRAGSDAIMYDYYQISGCGSSFEFAPYVPRIGEFNLLW